MNWQDPVVAAPAVLNGKPLIKGTRLSVEFLVGLFAQGWTGQQVLETHLRFRRDGLPAAFVFLAYALKDQDVILPRHTA